MFDDGARLETLDFLREQRERRARELRESVAQQGAPVANQLPVAEAGGLAKTKENLPRETGVTATPKIQTTKKPARSSRRRPAGPRTQERAAYFLDLLSMLVPKRIATEEIGDALELINKMVKAGRPKWFVYLKVTTTFWWVAVHTLLHYAERIAGIVKAVTGKSDKDK